MKDRLISYLAAAILNLALVWSTDSPPWAARPAVPALVRLFEGVEVTAGHDNRGGRRVHIGLILDRRLRLRAADPLDGLFPRTVRWDGLEAPVAVLN